MVLVPGWSWEIFRVPKGIGRRPNSQSVKGSKAYAVLLRGPFFMVAQLGLNKDLRK